jgi:hypothetical protein
MPASPTLDLAIATALCAVACALLLRRLTSWRVAIPLALAKALLAFVFFGWFYDGTWTILDDIAYYREGRVLAAAGFNPISVLVSKKGIAALFFVGNGTQFLYGWFNFLMQYLLAQAYWAPVFGNIVLTCISAVLLMILARDCGASERYARALGLYFVVQWEVVAWSSFVNVKDLLVMTLTLTLCLGLARIASRFTWKSLFLVSLAGFLLFWIRFYVPLVAGVALLATRVRPRSLLRGSVILVSMGVIALLLVLRPMIESVLHMIRPGVGDLAYGWLRTLLSPLPWSLETAYGFLQVPALLHFVTFPAAVYGAWLLLRRPGTIRFLFVYAALILVAVAAHPELQGPRHRIQILFLLSWAEFHGLYTLAATFVHRNAPAPLRTAT